MNYVFFPRKIPPWQMVEYDDSSLATALTIHLSCVNLVMINIGNIATYNVTLASQYHHHINIVIFNASIIFKVISTVTLFSLLSLKDQQQFFCHFGSWMGVGRIHIGRDWAPFLQRQVKGDYIFLSGHWPGTCRKYISDVLRVVPSDYIFLITLVIYSAYQYYTPPTHDGQSICVWASDLDTPSTPPLTKFNSQLLHKIATNQQCLSNRQLLSGVLVLFLLSSNLLPLFVGI